MFDFYDLYAQMAAGRMVLQGANPYDQQAIGRAVTELGRWDLLNGFNYPPWTLWILPLFGWGSPTQVGTAWSVVTLLLTVWFLIDTSRGLSIVRNARLNVLALVLFFPLWKHLSFGNTTALTIPALIALSHLPQSETRTRSFALGVIGSLAFLKLHILLLLIVSVACSLPRQRVSFVCGLLAGLCWQTLASYWIAPAAFRSFSYLVIESRFVPGTQPNPWSFLALVIGNDASWKLSGAACVAAGAWLGYRGVGATKSGILLRLTPLSVLFSPYAWSHDFLLLVPSWLWVYRLVSNRLGVIRTSLIAIPLTVLALHAADISRGDRFNIIMPLLLAVLPWLVPPSCDRARCEAAVHEATS